MRGFFKRLGEAWAIAGITLLFFVLIELCFIVYFWFHKNEDSRIQADCYENAEWVYDYYDEFSACNSSVWEPYVYWKRKPFKGEYINVSDEGLRKAQVKSSSFASNQPKNKLFFFGGSTMWGSGVRDEFTIPVIVGNSLSAYGYNIEATNFGESGYVSSQELIRLINELRNGNVPDFAIFYNGANDVFSSLQSGIAGITQNEYNREKEFNSIQEKKRSLLVFFQSLSSLATVKFFQMKFGSDILVFEERTEMELKDLAENTVLTYKENIRMINALAKQYKFEVFYYWQPTIFYKTNLSDYEQTETDKVQEIRKFYPLVNNFLINERIQFEKTHFSNLTGLFNNVKKPLFIDWCHVGEEGNEKISKRIIKDLLPQVDKLYNGNTRFDEQN